jgi:DNA-binding NarL/FixJ family response regulator
MTKVLLVEDDSFTLTTLQGALTQEGFEVTAASKVSGAIESFQNSEPDALVADLDLGAGPTGIDLALLLRKIKPDLGIVVLTSFQDPRLHRQASQLPAGTQYLVKQSLIRTSDLGLAINQAVKSAKTMDPLAQLPQAMDLTDVQIETMRMVAEGLTNSEIAKRRFVSDKAVEKTLKAIADSLKLPNDPNHNQRVSIARAYFKLTGGKI